ncbi:YpmS family protein [Desemzia sp. C1]|uniref:YpmS family protein n=1 Tax=Desemzia sp. C1 TaxID=2892016 RepID=UPI001E360318|nr:YpmS family protein [Desemzia sp. C1]MCI3029606.1 YpmS family protein [Desemzia sp. C1]
MEEKRAKKQTKSPINYWKWAFLTLAAVLLGAGIWLVQQLQVQPAGQEIVNETAVDTSDVMTFSVSARKEEVTQLMNQYIEEEVAGSNVNYEVLLDETFQLAGSFQLFGFEVPFNLFMDPYVTENGNIQLKANELSLGRLNLPISFAMNQIGSQLSIPDWVVINGENETITFNLNEFQLESGMFFSAERIDLVENDILVNVHVPASTNE